MHYIIFGHQRKKLKEKFSRRFAITRQIFSSITSKETKLIFGAQILKNKTKQIFHVLKKRSKSLPFV